MFAGTLCVRFRFNARRTGFPAKQERREYKYMLTIGSGIS